MHLGIYIVLIYGILNSLVARVPSDLLFQHVEVVYDDPDEEVEGEEAAADDEDDEVEVVVEGCLPLRLEVHLPRVHCVGHDLHPTLEGGLHAVKQILILNPLFASPWHYLSNDGFRFFLE